MPANHTPTSDTYLEQRAIVHQLLRDDDHTERWTPKQLQRALSDIAPETIKEALAELEAAGVAWRLDDYVGASHCVRHLFSLDLIGI
jgi:DNA-binding HxlR family transcriptional regulator